LKASTSSSKGRLAATFFSQTLPLFPFLLALEAETYPFVLVWFGMIVQVLQMLAFVINPRAFHGEALTAVSSVVYASQLPFWDSTFASTVVHSQ